MRIEVDGHDGGKLRIGIGLSCRINEGESVEREGFFGEGNEVGGCCYCCSGC